MARVLWVGAVEPGFFGPGPAPAVRQALDRAKGKVGDVEWVEICEACAAIALAVMQESSISEDIVNVEGGAIAQGHHDWRHRIGADYPLAFAVRKAWFSIMFDPQYRSTSA